MQRFALRALVVVLGVLLIVLGLLDYHVQIGAVIAGAIMLGALTGDELVRLIRAARGNGSPAP